MTDKKWREHAVRWGQSRSYIIRKSDEVDGS